MASQTSKNAMRELDGTDLRGMRVGSECQGLAWVDSEPCAENGEKSYLK
jgi:hypothetical protein